MVSSHGHEWAVIGAGPAGLVVVATLLSRNPRTTVLWVDPVFSGGRLHLFPVVPSNTKVRLFLSYARAISPEADVLPSVRKLQEMDGEEGCELGMVRDMVAELTEWVRHHNEERLCCVVGRCSEVCREDLYWKVLVPAGDGIPSVHRAQRIVLCTGCTPIRGKLPFPSGDVIDPEMLLNPSQISATGISSSDTVAVVGGSHTAILILHHLLTAPAAQQPQRIFNLVRQPLRFAEYLPDGRIKHDNTGLKGLVAQWAREHLCHAGGEERSQCFQGRLQRIHLGDVDQERAVYSQYLPQCTKLVWAIGYDRCESQMPSVLDQSHIQIAISGHDARGQLLDDHGRPVSGLYGMGIAFPERVVDPSGDYEYAVGLWKFVQTAGRLFGSPSST